MKRLSMVILASLIPITAWAMPEQENQYLAQMINQLNAMKPLIISAEKEQPSNSRIQFHYRSYIDADNNKHNGLLEDINAIETGIQAKLNSSSHEPRHFQAIKGDYLDNRATAHAK